MIEGQLTDLLDLDFLGRVVGREIRDVHYTTLKQDGLPTAVYRVESQPRQGGPIGLIVKLVEKDWPGDKQGHLREVHFYRHIAPRLALNGPHVLYSGPEPDGERQVIVMADYGRTHRFLATKHAWTMDELAPALDAYAGLHAGAQGVQLTLEEESLLIPRLEERVRETAAELSEMAAQLEELGVFPNLPGFEQALARFMDSMPAYEALPATILHLDSAPGNVGLPLNGAHSAIIVDWEMASWGLPEIDLAYIFVQPYDNARHLQRETVLAHYWSRHDELGRVAPPPDTQRARLRYAEQLWALWLIPAARRVALEPFTPGTAPAIHWEHMFPRLGRRLLYFVQGK